MSSFFGGFGKSDSSNYDFGSDPMGAVGGEPETNNYSSSSSSSSSGSQTYSAAAMQDMMLQQQQQVLIQQAISRITEMAFEKCVGKPDSSLSSREVSCIQNVAFTFVDSSKFIVGRLTKQNHN